MAKVPKANGRPRKEVDYKSLENLCAIQCSGEECASFLDMDYETLNRILKRDKHGGFKEYFALKGGKGKISLRRAQYQLAVEKKNPTMLIWLGKQYLGQKEPERAIDATEVEALIDGFKLVPYDE